MQLFWSDSPHSIPRSIPPHLSIASSSLSFLKLLLVSHWFQFVLPLSVVPPTVRSSSIGVGRGSWTPSFCARMFTDLMLCRQSQPLWADPFFCLQFIYTLMSVVLKWCTFLKTLFLGNHLIRAHCMSGPEWGTSFPQSSSLLPSSWHMLAGWTTQCVI